jgi:hypothetical protein
MRSISSPYSSYSLGHILFDLFNRQIRQPLTDFVENLKTCFTLGDELLVVFQRDNGDHRPTEALDNNHLTAKVDLAEQLRKIIARLAGTHRLDHEMTSWDKRSNRLPKSPKNLTNESQLAVFEWVLLGKFAP